MTNKNLKLVSLKGIEVKTLKAVKGGELDNSLEKGWVVCLCCDNNTQAAMEK